jgi:hypothetical protein
MDPISDAGSDESQSESPIIRDTLYDIELDATSQPDPFTDVTRSETASTAFEPPRVLLEALRKENSQLKRQIEDMSCLVREYERKYKTAMAIIQASSLNKDPPRAVSPPNPAMLSRSRQPGERKRTFDSDTEGY